MIRHFCRRISCRVCALPCWQESAELAVAAVDGRMQPTICLGYTHLYAGLGDFLAQGGRRVGEWQSGLRQVAVSFDDAQLFRNINTLEELAEAEKAP